MNTYFKATTLYMLAGCLLTVILHGASFTTLIELLFLAMGFAKVIAGAALAGLPFIAPLLFLFWRQLPKARMRTVLIVAIASIWLQVGFLMFKSAIPILVPFYADPFFAKLDQALLGGYDAWQIAHAITPDALVSWFPHLYLTSWSVLAYSIPLIVAATDPDDSRTLRYCWLSFLAWVVTGNILALPGSSVGPVYYDLLLGTERFADMRASFEASGYAGGALAWLQEGLWGKSGGRFSFISAFPSVHVAVASVVAIYIRERFRKFRLISDLFFAVILLISVYSGYHYLVDGIASLAIVLALHVALRRWFARGSAPVVTGEGADSGAGEPVLARDYLPSP